MKYLFGDKVDRNISSQVFLALLVVMFAVGGIDFLFVVLNELSDISDIYNLNELLSYSVMSMPYRLFDLTAYFSLIGVIFGLGVLSDNGELIGARILGKSYISIAISAFKPVFILILIGILASEFFIPNLSQTAEENRLIKLEGSSARNSYWTETDKGLVTFKAVPEKDKVEGLSLYEFNSANKVIRIINSKDATFRFKKWQINNPEVIFIDESKRDNIYSLDNLSFLGSDGDFSFLLSPKYLSLTDLYNQIELSSSKYRKNQLSLEFWRKILQPFITLSLVLLALGFLFGPLRDINSGQRIIFGIGIAFTVDLTQKLLGSISVVSSIPPFLAVLLPILIVGFLGFFLLRKVR